MKKISLVLEVFKVLSKAGEKPLTTTEIFEVLVSNGVLENKTADRKRLLRALSDMEYYGYVESCSEGQKGRTPQRWRINLKSFPYFVSLSEEEILSLLILTAFVPDIYREFEVIKPAFNIVDRLGKTVPQDVKDIAKQSFDYLPIPVFRCAFPEDEDLKLLFKAIINRQPAVILYRGNQLTVYPVKIFTYNGNFYLSAVNSETKRYHTYHFDKLKVLELLNEKFPLYYWKKYKNCYFAFKEEPFLYRIELPDDYYAGLRDASKIRIYPTQYHVKMEKNSVLVYLVGFTGYRYASWIALDEVKGFYPADEEDVEIAKSLNLKEKFSELSYSLEENVRRYGEFCKQVKKFFFKRLNVIENL